MDRVDRVTSKGTIYEISDSEAREVKLDKKDLPTNLSQFKNDIGAIDNTVSNLLNYYTKSETYTKAEIKELLSNRLRYLVVGELPEGDFDKNVIYLIERKSDEAGEQDFYDEYLFINGEWELIGNTFVDLSDYYRKGEADSAIAEKVGAEKTERENAEDELNAKIADLVLSLSETNEHLSDEKTRAEGAENTNRTLADTALSNIESERERAENAETLLSNRADVAEAHIENYNNPHNVTKEQLGLENVVNVGMDSSPMLYSENGVTSDGIFSALLGKVDKMNGKDLSDENFTFEEKMKLQSLENYDDTALEERVSENESAIATLNADEETAGSVDAKIKAAIEGITQFDFKIVDKLPDVSEAKKGVIYLVPEANSDVPEGNSDVPEGNSDVPEENSDIPEGNSDVPEGNSDVPESNSNVPESNSDEENSAGNEENAQNDEENANSDEGNAENTQENDVSDEENANSEQENDNNERYSEYIFIDGRFEHLGNKTVEMELSEYAKKNEVTALVSVKNDKIAIENASDTALTDTDTVLSAEAGSGIAAFLRHPMKKLWSYIAKKIADELGLTASQYGGNAATATTATTLGTASAGYTKASLDTALNGKQSTVTGGASTIASANLTGNRALISNASGKVTVSAVTSTELSYLSGATSNIQTTINTLQNASNYNKQYYLLDLSSLSTSNFYPVTFAATELELDCEIHSPNWGVAAAYNQNHIHFLLTKRGWSDTRLAFTVLSYGVFDTTEITIGSIGAGTHDGVNCVWLRGGMKYRFITNHTPTLRTSTYTAWGEVFTVGTNYYGGTNTNVSVIWNPLDKTHLQRKVELSTLKTAVASCSDFAAFKTKIAAL